MDTEKKFFIEDMRKAKVFLGRKVSKTHPKMKPYISGVKNGFSLIDLNKTEEKLKEALTFIKDSISQEKTILLVGTKMPASNLIKQLGEEIQIPYISQRWIGGLFTNFKEIRKRVEQLLDLEKKKNEGMLEKYTKKEKAEIEKVFLKLERKFGGIKKMEKLPDVVFIATLTKDQLAAKEAKTKGIKIISICNSDENPSLVDFFIPANNLALSSLKYILDKIKETISGAKIK